jgi:AraC family transcriptional regulator, positive regulator of tynA and feaB
MPSQERRISESETPLFGVWDSEYSPSSEAFSFFREEICSIFMPWSPEFESDQPFEGRIKALVFEDKSVAQVNISPLVAVRTNADVANSTVDGFYANFVLSGELHVEQAGHTSVAKRGDLVVYDTARPVIESSFSHSRYEDISFLIPKSCFSHVSDAEDQFGNLIVARERMINPLYSSLMFVAEHMQSISKDELISLYESCVSLLPMAAGCYGEQPSGKLDALQGRGLWQEILDFVNRNLAEPEMSPAIAAQHFGISVRYIHKIFAGFGTTFNAYIVARRLDNIRDDLNSPSSRNHPISTLAFRWGFRDLSSFNRAFKKRFGCCPNNYQAMSH